MALYLGVVEGLKDNNLVVSYMVVRADPKGYSWTYPESAQVLKTSQEQVLASKVKVQYLGSVRIRCKIFSKSLIQDTNNAILNSHFETL